jgi:hypothetical protein
LVHMLARSPGVVHLPMVQTWIWLLGGGGSL